MKFRTGSRLDTSQVSDRRGAGGGLGGLGGIGLGRGAVGGGGIVGVILVVVLLLANGLGGGGGGGGTTSTCSTAPVSCRRTANRSRREPAHRLPGRRRGELGAGVLVGAVQGYTPAQTVLFDGQTSTSCGVADSSVGPFYCPGDGARVHRPRSTTASHPHRGAGWTLCRGVRASRTSTGTTCRTCSAPSDRGGQDR